MGSVRVALAVASVAVARFIRVVGAGPRALLHAFEFQPGASPLDNSRALLGVDPAHAPGGLRRGRHQALERARYEALELVGLAALLRAQRGRDALRAARAVGHMATGVVSAPAKRRARGARGCPFRGIGRGGAGRRGGRRARGLRLLRARGCLIKLGWQMSKAYLGPSDTRGAAPC